MKLMSEQTEEEEDNAGVSSPMHDLKDQTKHNRLSTVGVES